MFLLRNKKIIFLEPTPNSRPGLEVIKLDYILRLKIKRNDWLLADKCVPKQPIIIVLYLSSFITTRPGYLNMQVQRHLQEVAKSHLLAQIYL